LSGVVRQMRTSLCKDSEAALYAAPLEESGGAVELEIVSTVEVAFLVEMILDRAVDGDELLQTSHSAEALHRLFPSSKRQMRILGSVVEPAAGFLPVKIADDLHSSAVRTQ